MNEPVVGPGRAEVIGDLRFHRAVTGEAIRPRDVAVWLPPGYEGEQGRYPVLYMHDGHNVFDPATSYDGSDWQLDEVIVGLADEGRIETPIVVAPYTDEYRQEEYWVGPTGDAYIAWMAGDLKEFIDSSYRTRTGPADTATMGSSMGGLGALRALLERPDVFSMAGCLSPAFVTDFQLPEHVASLAWPDHHIKLYIDNGGDELDTQFQPAIDEMLNALDVSGFADHGTLEWVRDLEGTHHESSWARRVWRPLELFFAAP